MLIFKKAIYMVFNNSKNQEENRVGKLARVHLMYLYIVCVLEGEC